MASNIPREEFSTVSRLPDSMSMLVHDGLKKKPCFFLSAHRTLFEHLQWKYPGRYQDAQGKTPPWIKPTAGLLQADADHDHDG